MLYLNFQSCGAHSGHVNPVGQCWEKPPATLDCSSVVRFRTISWSSLIFFSSFFMLKVSSQILKHKSREALVQVVLKRDVHVEIEFNGLLRLRIDGFEHIVRMPMIMHQVLFARA